MPALPNVPAVLKCNLIWQVDGDPKAQTVFHLKYTGGPPTAAQCATMAGLIVTQAKSAFQGLCATTVGASSCIVTDLTSATAFQGEGGTAWVGTRTGTGLLSPGTAVIANYQIGRRYRGGKPRSYLPLGTPEDVATAGQWSTAFQSSAATGVSTWLGDLLSVGTGCTISQVVNVSYYSGSTVETNARTGRAKNVPTPRPTPLVDQITGSSVPLRIGSQRRRNKDA